MRVIWFIYGAVVMVTLTVFVAAMIYGTLSSSDPIVNAFLPETIFCGLIVLGLWCGYFQMLIETKRKDRD
jgi:hypothetical protein